MKSDIASEEQERPARQGGRELGGGGGMGTGWGGMRVKTQGLEDSSSPGRPTGVTAGVLRGGAGFGMGQVGAGW